MKEGDLPLKVRRYATTIHPAWFRSSRSLEMWMSDVLTIVVSSEQRNRDSHSLGEHQHRLSIRPWVDWSYPEITRLNCRFDMVWGGSFALTVSVVSEFGTDSFGLTASAESELGTPSLAVVFSISRILNKHSRTPTGRWHERLGSGKASRRRTRRTPCCGERKTPGEPLYEYCKADAEGL